MSRGLCQGLCQGQSEADASGGLVSGGGLRYNKE